MKRAIAGLVLLICTATANAFDTWREESFKGGETVYLSGISEALIIGSRGIGYSMPSVEVIVGNAITITIDDEPPTTRKLNHLVAMTYLIDDTPTLIHKIAKAKKVKIQYSRCNNTVGGCSFTRRGIPDESVWEFETALSEQYPNYQQQISE